MILQLLQQYIQKQIPNSIHILDKENLGSRPLLYNLFMSWSFQGGLILEHGEIFLDTRFTFLWYLRYVFSISELLMDL